MRKWAIYIIQGLFVVMLAITAIVLGLEMSGHSVFQTPFYIREAKQPADFPRPGKVNEIVVKSYPVYRSASVQRSGAGQNQLFGELFDHIKSNEIAMTAPVEMTYDEHGTTSMSFLYADTNTGDLGTANRVQVSDQAAQDWVSIAARGAYSQNLFDEKCRQLRAWLQQHPEWQESGEPRMLGFNSPFVPRFLRYAEIQIPIIKNSP